MKSSAEAARRGNQAPRIQLEPGRTYTDGDDAATFSAAYGLTPDDWQKTVLDAWLGRDERDKYTATSCGLSVPRQNGKNGIIEMRELYGMCAIGEKILHTAHEVKTARKAFLRLCSFFENEILYPELAAMVVSIRRTNGQEAICLNNGADIEFSARSKSAARGFTKDIVVFDEAQELTEEQMEAILSTMAAAPLGNRQLIFTGTPPAPSSPGEVFRRVRNDAEACADKHLAWHEWSVEVVGDVADRERWYSTNPAMGIRLDEGFTETEMRRLSSDGFARERLGWWASSRQNATISEKQWKSLATDDPPKTEESKVAFGVKFSPDGAFVALSVALKPNDESTPYVEVIDHSPMGRGVALVAEKIAKYKDIAAIVVIDGRSNTDALRASLVDIGFPKKAIYLARTADVISASTRFLNAVEEKNICHFSQASLDATVASAIKRPIGKDGGFGWGSMGDVDVSQMEAVSLAYWGVMTTKRNPGRKLRVG